MEKGSNQSDFSDLKHSIHLFNRNGDRIADIDESGVKVYSDEIGISVCKETGQIKGWKEERMIFATKKLMELLKKK